MYMELYLEQATQEVLRNFSKQHGQKIILMEKQILILTMIEIKVKQTYLDMWKAHISAMDWSMNKEVEILC